MTTEDTLADTANDVAAAVASLEAGEPVPQEDNIPLTAEPAEVERIRDERGRYTKQRRAESLGSLSPEQHAAEIEQNVAARNDRSDRDETGPPLRWGREARDVWAKLPPSLQRAVSSQLAADEANMQRGVEVLKQRHAEQLQHIEQAFAPLRGQYAKHGFQNDVQALTHLAQVSAQLDRDPVGVLAFLAKQYGVVDQLLALAGQTPRQQYAPQPAQQYQPQQTPEQTAELQAAGAEIAEFARANRYFDIVRPQMAEIMMRGQAQTLEDAYQLALSQHPIYRDFERERKIEAKKRAANASLSGAPHGASPLPNGRYYRNGRAPRNHHESAAEDVRAAIEQLR